MNKPRSEAAKAADAARARARRAAKKQEAHDAEVGAAVEFIGATAADARAKAAERLARYNEAKAEAKARRTMGPALAAAVVDNPKFGPEVQKAARAALTVVPPVKAGKPESYVKALAAKKAKTRQGAGVKMTDDELVAAARRYQADGLTRNQALEVVYWLDGAALSRTRWNSVTAVVFAGEEVAAV